MGQWRRLVVAAVVSTVLAVLCIPNTFLRAGTTMGVVVDRVVSGVQDPAVQPVLLGIALLGLLLLSFLVIFWIVKFFTSVGASQGSRLARLYDRLTPESPRSKGLMFMLAFTVVFMVGIALFVPWFADTLTDDEIDRVFSDVQQGEYGGDLQELFSEDAVTSEEPTVSYRDAGVDTDGDGIPDARERAGETPDGEPLPGADPGQLDLYVQLNYGEDVTPLTAAERSRLEEIWSTMPVDNVNGSQGIDLHLATEPPGGTLDETARASGSAALDSYYTEQRLGERYCVYHQVVLGDINQSNAIGYAEAPGRAVFLDGRRFADYEGDVPFRTAMITHALLHTVVGEVDGGVHTSGGWLDYPSANNERLTDAVATQLETEGFVTTETYRQQCTN